MLRPRLGSLVRGLSAVVMAGGVLLFAGAAFVAGPYLAEGVTRRAGEGNVLPPEQPAETRERLVGVGALCGVAAAGWVLARLGDVYRRPKGTQPRLNSHRLAAEVLLFCGGVGLALAAAVGAGYRLAAHDVPAAYRGLGVGAGLGGFALLTLGAVLYRRSYTAEAWERESG